MYQMPQQQKTIMTDRCRDFIRVGDTIKLYGSTTTYTVVSYQFIGKDEISLSLRNAAGNLLIVNRKKHYVECLDCIKYNA